MSAPTAWEVAEEVVVEEEEVMAVAVAEVMEAEVMGESGARRSAVGVATPTSTAAAMRSLVEVAAAVVARGRRTGEAVLAPTGRRSSSVASGHSGTLPCLRRGSSSRLVANIRSPATSFWRVSAGSITSSM